MANHVDVLAAVLISVDLPVPSSSCLTPYWPPLSRLTIVCALSDGRVEPEHRTRRSEA
jgi:hypothetical protein